MLVVSKTVKLIPLLSWLPTETITFPVVAAAGTVAVILESLHALTEAVVPLKVNVLVPWEAPKFAPVTVTDVPTCPEVGEREEMAGALACAVLVHNEPNRLNTIRCRMVFRLNLNLLIDTFLSHSA
jgi:hypothetical protein